MARHPITDEGDPKQYWAQIPNVICELGLKPQELSLYVHLKRAAGASDKGKCTKSTATLARESGMGAGSVSRAKVELEKQRHEIGNKPLIRIKEVSNPRGGKPFQEISITDIWKENMARFTSSNVEVGEVDQVPLEVGSSSKPTSPVEIKKNVEEELDQEKQKPSAHAELMDFLSMKVGHISNGGQQGKSVKWLLERYDPVECLGCFNFLASQAWRSTPVTWATVQSNIGAWVTGRPVDYRDPMPEKLLPLPSGVRTWHCTACAFKVMQNGAGITNCPDCRAVLT